MAIDLSTQSTQKTVSIVFPSSRLLNSNIPTTSCLMMKFACTPWKNMRDPTKSAVNSSVATDVCSGMSPLNAVIMIPAPKQMQSMTKIKYVDDTNALQGLINTASQIGSVVTDLIISTYNPFLGASSMLAGKAREISTGRRDLDTTDAMFSNAEKRSYNITFTLVATSDDEAKEIANIVNVFQALSLPNKQNSWSLNIATPYQAKAYPPPLWKFGIGLGINPFIDPTWLGQTSFCVLHSVIVNTTTGGSPYMMEGGKPLMTTVNLMFTDYEPAYRMGDSYTIVPRSTTIK